MKLFYAWQSNLPNTINEAFIQSAIQTAVNKANIELLPTSQSLELDRDIKGRSGSVAIADIILEKISQSQLFVCDVTIVTPIEVVLRQPNANVMYELGYAARSLPWDNIICIMNSAYGRVEDLPFDVRHRRMVIYKLSDTSTEEEKFEQHKLLVDGIFDAIRLAAIKGDQTTDTIRLVRTMLSNPVQNLIELEKILMMSTSEAFEQFTSNDFIVERNSIFQGTDAKSKRWEKCIQLYFDKSVIALECLGLLCLYGDGVGDDILEDIMLLWCEYSSPQDRFNPLRLIPALLMVYTCGIASTHKKNWSYFSPLFLKPTIFNTDYNFDNPLVVSIADSLLLYAYRDINGVSPRTSITLGEILLPILKPLLNRLTIRDSIHEQLTDRFEMLFALGYLHLDPKGKDWMPPHIGITQNTAWKSLNDLFKEGSKQGKEWSLLKSFGIKDTVEFGTLIRRYMELREKFVQHHLFVDPLPDYAATYLNGMQT